MAQLTAAELRKKYNIPESKPGVDFGAIRFGDVTMPQSTPAVAKSVVASNTPVTDQLRQQFNIPKAAPAPQPATPSEPATISAYKPSAFERGFQALDKATGGFLGNIAGAFNDSNQRLYDPVSPGSSVRPIDFVPFGGSLFKKQEEKVTERYDSLVNAGVDEHRATQLAVADTLGPVARQRAFTELKPTPEEQKAMQKSRFFEGLDVVLSTVGDVGPAAKGLLKALGESAVKKLVTETSVDGVKTILRDSKVLNETGIDRAAPRIAKATSEDEVGRILTEEAQYQNSPIDRTHNLPPEMRAIEEHAAAAVESNPEAAVKRYLKENGNVINTDNARELFPAYQADRTASAAVHEPASYVAKQAYRTLLDTEKGVGNNTVLFTGGGTGSGKTTAIKGLENLAEYPIVYDSNLNTLKSSVAKIEQALAGGYKVRIGYVFNDIATAMDNALGRAERMATELGSGRTVPVDAHVDTHVGSQKVLQDLMAKYKNDPRVDFRLIDNSGPVAKVVDNPLAFLKKNGYTGSNDQLKKQLKDQITRALAEGKISGATARGFLGEKPGLRAADGGLPQQGAEAVASRAPAKSPADLARGAGETRPPQRSIPGQIPPKEAAKQPGLRGFVRSFESFSQRLNNKVNPTMRGEVEQALVPTALKKPENLTLYQNFRHQVGNAFNYMRRKVQDDMLLVKQLVEDPAIKVSDASDPYQAEILFHGRVGSLLEDADNVVKSVDQDIVRAAEKEGISDAQLTDEVNQYLIARHAPERNAAIGEGAAGMTTAEARATKAALEAKPHGAVIRRIADRIQEFNNKTLDILKDGEVIDQELYDLLRTKYKTHIPLYRVLETEEDFGGGLRRGFDVSNTGIRRAKGSNLKVDDIMGNVVFNYRQAVIRAEKNRVDLATLKLVRDNEDALGELFKVRKPRAIGEAFANAEGKRVPLMEHVTDPQTLVMREKGKPVLIEIADPNLAAALKGVSREKTTSLAKGIAAITRFYSGLQTRFNPEFAFSNKVRDLQEALVYAGAQSELGAKGAAGILTRSAKLENERAVVDWMLGRDTEGAQLYEQMRLDGGTTGGMGLSTKGQVNLDIADIRKLNRSKPRQAVAKLIEGVDHWNRVFEDSSRLTIYREALKNGASRERAARLAKESTVNFNKMGEAGPLINALYMFSNASIQGSAKMLMALKNPKVAAATVSAVSVPVFAVNEWNDYVDPNWRDKVTTWDRLNGLTIMLPTPEGEGVKYFTIPVSWGIKPIKVMADQLSDLASGHSKGLADATGAVMVSALEGYNPIGGTDLISAVTPTVLDIPIEVGRNQAWYGGKIRPDWDRNAPASIQYFDSLRETTTGQAFVGLSKGLSGIGIEVSPADLNYAYGQLVGGAGRSVDKTVNTVIAAGQGTLPPARDIPFVSRFLRTRTEQEVGAGSSQYDDIKKVLEQQSKESFYLNQQAEDSYQQLKNLPKGEAAKRFGELQKADPDLAKKVAQIAKEDKKDLTYTDRLVLQLGVANGERAKYIVKRLNEMPDTATKAALWEEYTKKGILSKEVKKQVTTLLGQQTK